MTDFSADDAMTVAASRYLADGAVCFVGIGLPSTAANLARRTHAPEPRTRLRVRHTRLEAGAPPAVDRRRRAGRHRRQRDQRAGGLQLLAATRAHRRRLPQRRADRPLRQHQLDGDRQLRRPQGPSARSGRRAGDRRLVRRGRRAPAPQSPHVRGACRLRLVGGLRYRRRLSREDGGCAAAVRRSSSPTRPCCAPTRRPAS